MITVTAHLVLKRNDAGEARHFLGGKLVVEGTELEVMLPNGTWLRGRYAWSLKEGELPVLRLPISENLPTTGLDADQQTEVALPDEAVVRWPAGVTEAKGSKGRKGAPTSAPKAKGPAGDTGRVATVAAMQVAMPSTPGPRTFAELQRGKR